MSVSSAPSGPAPCPAPAPGPAPAPSERDVLDFAVVLMKSPQTYHWEHSPPRTKACVRNNKEAILQWYEARLSDKYKIFHTEEDDIFVIEFDRNMINYLEEFNAIHPDPKFEHPIYIDGLKYYVVGVPLYEGW